MRLCKCKHFLKPAECQRNLIFLPSEQNTCDHPAFPGIGRVWGWDLSLSPDPSLLTEAQLSSPAQCSHLSPWHCFAVIFRKWIGFFTLLKIQTPLLKKLSTGILYILFHIFYILFHTFPKFEGGLRVLFP